MPWVYLLLAGAFEVAWAVGLKWALRHPRYWPLAAVFVLSIASFLLLARAMRDLPLGPCYLVWTGIGALGAAICGMALYGEPVTPGRIGWMLVVLVGVVGLQQSVRSDPKGPVESTSPPTAPQTASPIDR